jgi:hypothetical protein
MSKRAIVSFFRPSLLVIILTAAMLSIAIPAQFQRWSPNSDEVIIASKPKPPFYDELAPYPFYLIYVYLMIPASFVGAMGWIFSLWGLYDLPAGMTTPFGAILHLIYFYVLSCFVALVYRNIKDNERWHQRVQNIKSS